MNDNDSPLAASTTTTTGAPADRGSLARGVLVGLGAIAAGGIAMAALQFLAFDVIGGQRALALLPALLSLFCVPLAIALPAADYFHHRRTASAWGVLLAAVISLALLLGWIYRPAGVRDLVGAGAPRLEDIAASA